MSEVDPLTGRPWIDFPPLTVDEAIAALEAIRAAHGGDVPLRMPDQEPVLRIEYVSTDRTYHAAYVCDRLPRDGEAQGDLLEDDA